MKDKKNEGSILTPILLIIMLVVVARIITPGLDGMDKMFNTFLKDLDKSDPTAVAIFFLIALVLGGGLAVISDIGHKSND